MACCTAAERDLSPDAGIFVQDRNVLFSKAHTQLHTLIGLGCYYRCYFHLKCTKTRPKLSESFSTR